MIALLALLACQKDLPPDPVIPPPDLHPVQPTPRFDTLIVPGERVGPVDNKVDRDKLVELFGASAVSEIQVDVGEGTFVPGLQVAADDRSLSIVFEETSTGREVVVRNLGTAWRTADGVGLGSTLSEVEAAIGGFALAGMEWDYAGTVDLTGTKLESAKGKLFLRLHYAGTEPDPAALGAVMGDRYFPSSDPNMQKLGLTVYDVVVRLP